MRIIRSIRIRNFRSLRNISIADLNHFVPIAGLNGSGKSNVLRALNLFFNDEVEAGVALDMKRDHFDPGKRLGGKREIRVGVEFDLSGYDPRAEVSRLFRERGIDPTFAVERRWRYLDPTGRAIIAELWLGQTLDDLDIEQAMPEDEQAAMVFVRSILFRYIPNHVRPADVLAAELQTLQRSLLKRFRSRKAYREGGIPAAMEDLAAVATDLTAGLGDVLRGTPELSAIALDIPKEFADLAFELGMTVKRASGLVQPPEMQGSGTQSFLLMHVLALLDQAVFEVGFGWTKASVWAMEEPESFLHAGLRSRLATDLDRLSMEPKRQVFVTTHQDEFIRAGERCWIVTLDGAASGIQSRTARDALLETSRLGVSTFPHPLMSYPDKPLVLVEGTIDVEYLSATMAAIGMRPRWALSAIPLLDPDAGGGDAALAYLKSSRAILSSRPPAAPVVVVLDWEVKDGKVDDYDRALNGHGYSGAVKCPPNLVNPQLGESFHGIERYLSTELVEQVAADAVSPSNMNERYPLRTNRRAFPGIKNELVERYRRQGVASQFMVDLAKWIDAQVAHQVEGVPVAMFLPFTQV